MDDVVESCPAWESGVRKGDVIVTVNDWLIVLMDRPQVMESRKLIKKDQRQPSLPLLLCLVIQLIANLKAVNFQFVAIIQFDISHYTRKLLVCSLEFIDNFS